MKNAVIGFISVILIVIIALAITTSTGRNMRRNELDAKLDSITKEAIINLKEDHTYAVKTEDELKADIIQSLAATLDAKAVYDITFYTLDIEKGLIDVGVVETYGQFNGTNTVSARKMVVYDAHYETDDDYCPIVFMDAESNVLKRLYIKTGDSIPRSSIPNVPDGTIGFQSIIEDEIGSMYKQSQLDDISDIVVTKKIIFMAKKK